MTETKKLYEEEFKPLLEEGNYSMAAMKLIKHQEVKEYLSNEELIGILNFYEEEAIDLISGNIGLARSGLVKMMETHESLEYVN